MRDHELASRIVMNRLVRFVNQAWIDRFRDQVILGYWLLPRDFGRVELDPSIQTGKDESVKGDRSSITGGGHVSKELGCEMPFFDPRHQVSDDGGMIVFVVLLEGVGSYGRFGHPRRCGVLVAGLLTDWWT